LSIVIPAREWPSASVRAVLDTNIAVAGLPWRGKSYEVFGLTLTGKVLCFASDTLLAELDRVLGYKSSPCVSLATLTTISELLAEYRSFVEIVPAVTISPTMTTDPDDDHVLACAIAANADLIVSGDKTPARSQTSPGHRDHQRRGLRFGESRRSSEPPTSGSRGVSRNHSAQQINRAWPSLAPLIP
jgi:putative PIN family toxin of toxin-antitoxin system